ncbi:MAG: hypothetical protein R2818_04285 [Flavobacteriales bacterium]
MKHSIFVTISFALILIGCEKDDNTPTSSSGVPTGGTNGTGLITSWSPVKPYPDDAITLTGGPFSTDPADNVVTAWATTLNVLSVSSTQLVVQAPSTFIPFTGGYSNLIVTSGNNADTIPYLYWKRPMNLQFLQDNLDQTFSGQPARAGDSVEFQGHGFTPSGMSVLLDNIPMTGPMSIDSSYYGQLRFRIPLSLASGYDESTLTTLFVSATNADGRTDTLTIPFAPTPDMRLNGIELIGGGSVFSLAQLNGGGQVLNFRVYGRYLFATAPWTLTGPSPTNGTLGVGGYPNEAFVVVNPVSMSPGTYSLSMSGTFINYGFTLTP